MIVRHNTQKSFERVRVERRLKVLASPAPKVDVLGSRVRNSIPIIIREQPNEIEPAAENSVSLILVPKVELRDSVLFRNPRAPRYTPVRMQFNMERLRVLLTHSESTAPNRLSRVDLINPRKAEVVELLPKILLSKSVRQKPAVNLRKRSREWLDRYHIETAQDEEKTVPSSGPGIFGLARHSLPPRRPERQRWRSAIFRNSNQYYQHNFSFSGLKARPNDSSHVLLSEIVHPEARLNVHAVRSTSERRDAVHRHRVVSETAKSRGSEPRGGMRRSHHYSGKGGSRNGLREISSCLERLKNVSVCEYIS